MMRAAIIIVVCFWASSGAALTCLPATANLLFHRAASAADNYVILHGRLSFDPRQLPQGEDHNGQELPVANVPARFSGRGLTLEGFTAEISDRQITLEAQCFDPWCGGLDPTSEHLIFVEVAAGSYRLRLDPCGGDVVSNPTRADLQMMTQCIRGGRCPQGSRLK